MECIKETFPTFFIQADKDHSATQSDHLLVQTELQKLEEDANSERTSQEDLLSTLKNQLTDKL